MTILLKGYYGFGNFGDDYLMVTGYQLLKKNFPGCRVDIYSEASNPGYFSKLIGENVSIVSYLSDKNYDLIFHGGGGVHFDFERGSYKDAIFNKFISLIGYQNFTKLYSFYKGKIKSAKGITCKKRIGFGLGIGTFTNSSKKLRSNLPTLLDYSFLMVRDHESVENFKVLNKNLNPICATDLAFLNIFGKPKKKISDRKKIGFVLRDWKLDNSTYLEILIRGAIFLQQRDYEIVAFSLDKSHDTNFISLFAKSFPIHIWDPFQHSISDFLDELSKMDVLVSSSAHGIIVGACIGVPSVCVEVEPKIRNVSKMLPLSSHILPPPFESTVLASLVEKAEKKSASLVEEDVLNNQKKIQEALESLKDYLLANPL